MRARRKILLQGLAAAIGVTVGLLGLAAVVAGPELSTVALEYRAEPVELEPMTTAAERPTVERRRRPAAAELEADQGADLEPEPEPPEYGEPKNGDPPAGLLAGVAAKMIDNAIATFWSLVNALIVGVTLRRYSKAGKEVDV